MTSPITTRDWAIALRRVMAQRNVTDKSLGDAVGKDRRTVANWRRGDFLPDTPTAYRIAAALDDQRLFQMVVRRREGKCRYCGNTTVAISNRPRIWCNATCRDRFRYNRTPREAPEVRAIWAMCQQCEPEGACFTPDCPLRKWSPFPLAPDAILPMARSGGKRRAA